MLVKSRAASELLIQDSKSDFQRLYGCSGTVGDEGLVGLWPYHFYCSVYFLGSK